jgi:branched-subunit amino acid ABC-type transport system permease component
MFSLTTTMFYMLSAYIAFLIGSSSELSLYLIVLVPLGFVSGFLLDRLNSVKKRWADDQQLIINTIVTKYFMFLLVAGVFCAAGWLFTNR